LGLISYLHAAQEEIEEPHTTLAAIIPLLNEDHKDIFIDSTLYNVPCPPYPTGALPDDYTRKLRALKFIRGVVIANDLKIITDEDNIVVVGNDLARVTYLEEGYFDEEFLGSVKGLAWDIIPVKGGYIVEYPIGHQKLMDTLVQYSHLEYELELNIVSYTEEKKKTTGLSFSDFINFNLNYFDMIHKGLSASQMISGSASIRLLYQNSNLENILDGTITSRITGQAGRDVESKVVSEIPYEVFSRNREGEIVNQSLEFIESGITINCSGHKLRESVTFQFQLEVSNAVPTTSGYPTIVRRSSTTDTILKVNQVKEIARIQIGYKNETNNRRIKIFNRKTMDEDKETLVLMVRRIR
jgi:hypothetical protein